MLLLFLLSIYHRDTAPHAHTNAVYHHNNKPNSRNYDRDWRFRRQDLRNIRVRSTRARQQPVALTNGRHCRRSKRCRRVQARPWEAAVVAVYRPAITSWPRSWAWSTTGAWACSHGSTTLRRYVAVAWFTAIHMFCYLGFAITASFERHILLIKAVAPLLW